MVHGGGGAIIAAAGGIVATDLVDALDEEAVDRHADAVAKQAGGIDVSSNAIGIGAAQGTPLVELASDDFTGPFSRYTHTHASAVTGAVANVTCGAIVD